MNFYVGIDPGARGGVVVINDNFDIREVFKNDGKTLKEESDLLYGVHQYLSMLVDPECSVSTQVYCILERVGAAPKQTNGVARLCTSFGLYWGMLVSLGFFERHENGYAELAGPSRWRRGIGVTKAFDKGDIYDLVREILYPSEFKLNKDIADAAAIAIYCRKLFKED